MFHRTDLFDETYLVTAKGLNLKKSEQVKRDGLGYKISNHGGSNHEANVGYSLARF